MAHTLTILMADDDYEDIELVEDAITSIRPDANLHKLMNGKTVIDYLNSKADNELPCLIVLDYNMPELTGSEVLSIMGKNKRYENIPKIILSTSSTPSHIRECINKGAAEYFVKPNNMKDLIDVAHKMLSYCQ